MFFVKCNLETHFPSDFVLSSGKTVADCNILCSLQSVEGKLTLLLFKYISLS